ncbi:MAG: LysM peptidoglycan-binding domain-containing protein [Gemmatimonadota bacterium]
MKRQHVFAIIALALATPVLAQEPQAPAQQGAQQREHVVKAGDTLWDLAQFYYHNPWQWGRIYEANTGTVENPHWIYPAEQLIIPALADTTGAPAQAAPAQVATARPSGRTRFYTAQPVKTTEAAQGPTVLTEETAVEPDVRPGDFYSAPWLEEPAALKTVGKLVKVQTTSKLTWRMSETAYPYDILYLAYTTPERPSVGERLVLVNVGRKVGAYGKVIRPAAIVKVRSTEREVMDVQVVKQYEPVTTGAVAVREEEFPTPAVPKPEPVTNGAKGEILGFSQDDAMHGVEATAFISLGSANGIKIGDELEAWVPEHWGDRKRVKELLPQEKVADLRIVRVMERTATARVFHLAYPALEKGLPVRVVRKMP